MVSARPQRSILSHSTTAIIAAIFLLACTDDGSMPEATHASTTTVQAEDHEVDGRLRIGLLLPNDVPLVADAISTAAQGVVDEINAAGGVLGNDIELVALDEGTSASDTVQSIINLGDNGVDAIVGPITSTNAVTAVDIASSSGIVTCSPTATAAILDDVPDRMLFFRTIASDSMQAAAIAETAENTGARSVTLIHVDDAFGRPYAAATEAELDKRALKMAATISFSRDDDLSVIATEVADANADVLIVLAAGPSLAVLLAGLAGTEDSFDTIITNDAIRSAATQPVIAELPPELRGRLLGVAPQITDRQTNAESIVFSPQVTDCFTLLALSTMQADSDDPRLIATQLPSVSSGGLRCRSFETCAAQIKLDRQIDYDGPTGLTELNRSGQTSRAWFERFTFDPDGTDRFEGDARLQIAI